MGVSTRTIEKVGGDFQGRGNAASVIRDKDRTVGSTTELLRLPGLSYQGIAGEQGKRGLQMDLPVRR